MKPEPWNPELEVRALSVHEGMADPSIASRPQAETISLASVWQMESPEVADRALGKSLDAFVYRRDGHPNDASLAAKLAHLHGARKAVLTAQGMSSIAAIAIASVAPGSSVWLADELYGKTFRLFRNFLAPWGINVQTFDPTSTEALSRLATERVSLVLIETLSNPCLRVADVTAVARATHSAGGKLVVDNTFATHLLFRPLAVGADLVVESLSKQVNGHSDSMLGMAAGNDLEFMARVQDVVSTFGMATSPLDCYLTQRGLLSLAVRLERACDNALAVGRAIAAVLDSGANACLRRVDYPGLESHPQHQLAANQLSGGFGWMLTVHLNEEQLKATEFLQRLLPEIPFVPSLGDTCTTVTHPASTSHRGLTVIERERLGITSGTVRISCGLEPTQWLVDRFLAAIDVA